MKEIIQKTSKMKTVKKNVYYCDFCNKRSLSASHMIKHELHCTANINRECKLCDYDDFENDLHKIVESLKSRFIIEEENTELGVFEKVVWTGDPATIDEIKRMANDCPNCTLAALRLTNMHFGIFNFDYDYKKHLQEWYAERDQEQTYEYFHQ